MFIIDIISPDNALSYKSLFDLVVSIYIYIYSNESSGNAVSVGKIISPR